MATGHDQRLADESPINFDRRRITHAYIVSGEMADTVAMAVVCSEREADRPCGNCTHCRKVSRNVHPDIAYLSKRSDKREILVEQIREMKKDVIVVPHEAQQKAYIINDADLMNTGAQNAFLQVLEEPATHAVFILRTDTPTQLLPTVRSRCVHVKLGQNAEAAASKAPKAPNDDGFDPSQVSSEFFQALEQGNAAIAEFMFLLEKLTKDQFDLFLSSAHHDAALNLRLQASGRKNIPAKTIALADRLLIKAKEFLDQNVSIGHISGFICANLVDC